MHAKTFNAGWFMLVGGLVGFAASLILTVEKIHLLQNPSAGLPCDLNPIISCGSVMKTTQAEVFGIPNSLIGVGAFAALAALGVALIAGAQFRRWLWLALQGGMLAGLVFVHWLFFQSVYTIGSLCPYCMVVWVATIATAWYITLDNLKHGRIPIPARLKGIASFAIKHHADILITWYLLIVVAILHRFWYYWQTLL